MGRIQRVRQEADAIREQARFEPITILVWGPGDPGPSAPEKKRKAYEKRLKIKEVLRATFRRASVHFSEDREMLKIAEGIHGTLRKEALQAKLADLILMLDVSRGVDLELDHFVPTYPWFRDKVYVFLPKQFVESPGLVAEVLKYLRSDQVEGFSKEEFRRCDVARVKAVRAAMTWALDSYLRRTK